MGPKLMVRTKSCGAIALSQCPQSQQPLMNVALSHPAFNTLLVFRENLQWLPTFLVCSSL